MVCDASVKLKITDPLNRSSKLSTDDYSINVNPGCNKKEYISVPDFEAKYQVGSSGKYQMELTAVTANGKFTITDEFEVWDEVPFDIERTSATRIFPPIGYPVNIVIKANKDFSGEIKEIVPSSFDITSEFARLTSNDQGEDSGIKLVQKVSHIQQPGTAKIKTIDDIKEITWEVSLKKGEEFHIEYWYMAPQISPEFYLLGPLSLNDHNGEISFSELRQWQIAADAITLQQIAGTAVDKLAILQASLSSTAITDNLLVVVCGGRSATPFTVPTGFQTAVSEPSPLPNIAIFYKISTGGEQTFDCANGDK
jgi:hypothetical protein